MSNDSLKIRAAAFAIRAGHTDQMAEDFVTALCQMGIIGRTDCYGEVLADLMRNAGRGGINWATLVNSHGMVSEVEWVKLCEAALAEVQDETRRRAAAKVRAAIEQNTAFRPKWEAGMRDAAELIEKG